MKNMRIAQLASLILAGGISLSTPAALFAQDPGRAPLTQEQQTQTPDDQSNLNSFSGKVTKGENGKFMLLDVTKASSYTLDDQKLAKKFAGKNVVVTGTLDQNNNTIRVKKIELAA